MVSSKVADEIVIRISADIQKAKTEITSMIGELKGLQKEVSATDRSTQILDRGLKAFSWMTFAQGALNVSTALTQVATSFSNLERVQYQVKASMVAVERAEDQIARKTLQLNNEMAKHGATSEKTARLMDEIGTASEQLAVKQERLKIAQGNVNETYALFFSNWANTGFGILQTVMSLKTMLAQRTLMAKLAVDAETQSLVQNTGAVHQNSGAQAIKSGVLAAGVGPITGLIAAERGLQASNTATTFSIRGLTAAMAANPIFLPLVIASTIASIGIMAWQQQQLAKETDNLTNSLGGLSSGFDLSASSGSAFSGVVSTTSGYVSDLSQRIEDLRERYMKALEDFEKAQEALSKKKGSLEGMIFGTDVEQSALKSAQTQVYTQGEIFKAGIRTKAEIEKITKAIGGGATFAEAVKAGEVTPEAFQDIKRFINDIKSHQEDLFKITGDVNKAWDLAIDQLGDVNNKYDISVDRIREINDLLNKQNKLTDDQNGKSKHQNDLLRERQKHMKEIADLKKKLMDQYGWIRGKGSEFRDFISGETNYFMGEEGPGFQGYIDKRLDKVVQDITMINMVESLDKINKAALNAFNVASEYGLDPLPAMRFYEAKVREITSGRNFTASPRTTPAMARFSNILASTQREWRKMVQNAIPAFKGGKATGFELQTYPTYGGVDANSKQYTKQIQDRIQKEAEKYGFETPGGLWRATASSVGGLNFTSSLARSTLARQGVAGLGKGVGGTNVNMSVSRTTSQSPSSRKAAGKSSKHGGWNPTRWIREESERYVANALQASLELTQLGSYFGLGAAPRPSGVNLNFGRVTAEGFAVMMTRAEKDFRAAQIEYSMRINQYQQSITGITSRVGITLLGEVSSLINNPLTYNDIDDRLRYSDRMEQISTGATIL